MSRKTPVASPVITVIALSLFLFLISPENHVVGWILPTTGSSRRLQCSASTALAMNVLSDLGDMLTGGKLIAQNSVPYGQPLADVSQEKRTFAIQERLMSFSGEDFDVQEIISQGDVENYVRVRGALLHLPGKDKMRIVDASNNQMLAVLDRKLLAMKPTYDLYRGDASEKVGWIEKATISLTDTFDVHVQAQQGGFGPFKPPPAFKLEGDFFDRRFVVKNAKNEVVAKVTKDRLVEFDAFDHYQVQVAAGMDPVLVIACACAIDEEFDEEHKELRKRQKGRE